MPITCCHLGLGANLGQPEHTLRAAVDIIAALPGTTLRARSALYRTPAWGGIQQPDFLNAVVMIDTELAALDLLHALWQIERQHGRDRQREIRWGPRTLDIDILLYGHEMLDLPELHLPHPRLHQRAFALVPLLEIAPDIHIPGIGPARDALAALPTTEPAPQPLHPAPVWNARP